jgi:hypothetical protein
VDKNSVENNIKETEVGSCEFRSDGIIRQNFLTWEIIILLIDMENRNFQLI